MLFDPLIFDAAAFDTASPFNGSVFNPAIFDTGTASVVAPSLTFTVEREQTVFTVTRETA